jgi:hypothetical protein
MHMAELYALGIAIKSVAGQRGKNFNFVTDSRVALDMLTKRKGGAAHAILKEVERIETEGATVKLWWSSDRNRGIAEADRIAKRARERFSRTLFLSQFFYFHFPSGDYYEREPGLFNVGSITVAMFCLPKRTNLQAKAICSLLLLCFSNA